MLSASSLTQRRLLAALLAAGLLLSLFATTPPASANHSGDGAGAAHWQYASEGVQQDPPCGAFYSLDYTGEYVGSVTLQDNSGEETYTGEFTITFEDHLPNKSSYDHATDDHWHANPDGLYAPTDHTCSGDGSYEVDLDNVQVASLVSPSPDDPGIECGTGQSGNNNGSLRRSGTMLDVVGVKANCKVSDGVPDGDGVAGANNVDIAIDSTFAGPCWRNGAEFPLPPENCVTEDLVSFHQR